MTDDRLSGLALIAGSGGTIITMSLHPTGRVAAAQVESMIHVLIAVHALALACVPIQFLGAWGLSRRVASPDRLAVAGLVLYTIWRSKLGVTKPSATAAFITASRANAFVHLVLSGLFDSTPSRNPLDPPRAKYPPYTHQVDMLRRGIASGEPSVVTSGTGSGKTEAFLLPVFARLTKEASYWPKPEQGYLSGRWWQDTAGRPIDRYTNLPNRPLSRNRDGSPFVPQRKGEKRILQFVH